MTTHLKIDDTLLQEALVLGEHRNEKAAIEEALRKLCAATQTVEDFGIVWRD